MLQLTSAYVGGVFTINGIPQSNTRKLMKLKIFLNANKNYNYSFLEDELKVNFLIDDEIFVTQEITKISSYINNLFECTIEIDNELNSTVNDINFMKEKFDNDSKLLVEYKNSNIENIQDYKDFCNFCDSTLTCTLRLYQYKASFFLTFANGGFDFSVPGSGKTIISYATYNYFKYNKITDCILIVGPINSYNAWYDEYKTCFGINPNFTSLANMSNKDAETYLLSSKQNHSEITFINVDKAWRMTKKIIEFLKGKNVLLIIDEAHKEKNPDAEITKSVMEITKFVTKKIILTGTPMPNGYEDLFSLLKIYSPYQKLLSYNYSDLKKMSKTGATKEQIKRIMDAIFPYYSRVSKKYLLDTKEILPAMYTYINCQLSTEQKIIYDFLDRFACDLDNDFDSLLNQSLMRAVLIRKMQVSANPGLLSKSIISSIDEYKDEYAKEFDSEDSENELLLKADLKLKKLISNSEIASLINRFDSNYIYTTKNLSAVELALKLVCQGEKVIIWDVFVQNMNTLKNMLETKTNLQIEIINGNISGNDRQVALNNFKYGSSMILIANPATLAESISLHKACQNAIYVNRNFNAAQFIQSKDRIHRINMPINKTANYYFLINNDSVDQIVNDRLILKENRMLEILDSDGLPIGGNEFENNSFMSIVDVIEAFRR